MFTIKLQDSVLPSSIPGVAYTLAGVTAVTIIISRFSKHPKLDAFPTVRSNGWLGSLWAGFTFDLNALELVQQGYEKYKSTPFKIPDRYRWFVVVSGHQHVNELRKAPDDVLSFHDTATSLSYALGPELARSTYHAEIIRTRFTRNLGNLYPEVKDELSVTLDETLDLKDNEWKAVQALGMIQKVVCRTSNRIFVGFPLCRDPEWLDINVQYTNEVVKTGRTLQRFPEFMLPLIGPLMTGIPKATRKRAVELLTPVIEERLKLQEEHGADWPGKPNDMLSWMLDEAPEGPERTARAWSARILTVNFAAIHTSSLTFYRALVFLAENPEYIQPLREEADSVVGREGWSKASLGKMRKIDSFLRESQRLTGLVTMSLTRKALADFTFSDGTFIPKGTFVTVPALCLHREKEIYANADTFDPFRFSDMREEEGEGTKYQFVSTSSEYLAFGHGRHACPGRFFAASELKSMLAHIVMSYDVKLADDKRPEEWRDGFSAGLDPTAKIMFKRRTN